MTILHFLRHVEMLIRITNICDWIVVDNCMQKCSSMLYVFDVLRASGGTDWIKIGFTSQSNPWIGISNGFWTNVHPPELCGCLSPDNLDLIFLFEADRAVEAVVRSLFPPDHGEFWHKGRQDEIVNMIKLMCHELPIPSRPHSSTYLARDCRVAAARRMNAVYVARISRGFTHYWNTRETCIKDEGSDALVART